MRKTILFIIAFAMSSVVSFAQTNTTKTDTINKKVVNLKLAKVQPVDVSEKNVQQKTNTKTNPEEATNANSNATINRRKK